MTLKEAFTIMDAIAFTLCAEYGANVTEDNLTEFTEWVNERSRNIFVAFCDDKGIKEIEEG